MLNFGQVEKFLGCSEGTGKGGLGNKTRTVFLNRNNNIGRAAVQKSLNVSEA